MSILDVQSGVRTPLTPTSMCGVAVSDGFQTEDGRAYTWEDVADLIDAARWITDIADMESALLSASCACSEVRCKVSGGREVQGIPQVSGQTVWLNGMVLGIGDPRYAHDYITGVRREYPEPDAGCTSMATSYSVDQVAEAALQRAAREAGITVAQFAAAFEPETAIAEIGITDADARHTEAVEVSARAAMLHTTIRVGMVLSSLLGLAWLVLG